jgi:5-methylcytosine-specific restriction endonuclease McrA
MSAKKQSDFYKEYIRSDTWRHKCEQRLKIADYKCEMCGRLQRNCKDGRLQIHHITYRNLGDEDVANDIIALCGSCHIKIHKYYDRKRA